MTIGVTLAYTLIKSRARIHARTGISNPTSKIFFVEPSLKGLGGHQGKALDAVWKNA